MSKIAKILMIVAIVIAGTSRAEGGVGNPSKMHFPQLPDLDNGLDVLGGPLSVDPNGQVIHEKFLADDWLCTETGPVTDIQIWGSYLNDNRMDPPAAPLFNLAIYSNIPADPPGLPYSRPGQLLWSDYVFADVEEMYAGHAVEEFYDPNLNQIVGTDTDVWQYNFHIDPAEAFIQEAGQIYWLGVHHSFDLDASGSVNVMDLAMLVQYWPWGYGWKTTEDHFEDAAVWTDVSSWGTGGQVVGAEPWLPLHDPRDGQAIDLAFVIMPDPRLPGDADSNGWVGGNDLSRVLTNWGKFNCGWGDGDVAPYPTGNGFIGGSDYTEILDYWGTGIPPETVPEPATLGLLLLSSLAARYEKGRRNHSLTPTYMIPRIAPPAKDYQHFR